MTTKTLIVLAIGTGAMLIPIVFMMLMYRTKLWKSVPVAVLLTVTGTLGTYIWFYIENFAFEGRSFYGAVFLVPVAFWGVAKVFRIPYGELMDFCAPAECVMLAIMKYQCSIDGCCSGRELYVNAEGIAVCFPSQIVEMANALIIFTILFVLAFFKKNRGTIYPWYLVLYGFSRFVLNFFREEWAQYDGGLPPYGTIWSVVAVAVGFYLLRRFRGKTGQHLTAGEYTSECSEREEKNK